jgi:hypothetical protein
MINALIQCKNYIQELTAIVRIIPFTRYAVSEMMSKNYFNQCFSYNALQPGKNFSYDDAPVVPGYRIALILSA